MRIGIFADAHDHVDHVRAAVAAFNELRCDLVLFAGDFVSPIVIPPLRKLNCRMLACFGDNEGNHTGIQGGLRIIGAVGFPPFGLETEDGVRIVLTHRPEDLRGHVGDCDVIIHGHTHRSSIQQDGQGRWVINPGETSGWTFRQPSIAVMETAPLSACIVSLEDYHARFGEMDRTVSPCQTNSPRQTNDATN